MSITATTGMLSGTRIGNVRPNSFDVMYIVAPSPSSGSAVFGLATGRFVCSPAAASSFRSVRTRSTPGSSCGNEIHEQAWAEERRNLVVLEPADDQEAGRVGDGAVQGGLPFDPDPFALTRGLRPEQQAIVRAREGRFHERDEADARLDLVHVEPDLEVGRLEQIAHASGLRAVAAGVGDEHGARLGAHIALTL